MTLKAERAKVVQLGQLGQGFVDGRPPFQAHLAEVWQRSQVSQSRSADLRVGQMEDLEPIAPAQVPQAVVRDRIGAEIPACASSSTQRTGRRLDAPP